MSECLGKKAELVAPGGSLTAAIYAFKHGADAVYAGLTEFSARAHAHNLTMEQLARLKGFAEKGGKRIYVTLNTVVRESEMERIARILETLSFLEIDAIVLQDMGLLRFIRRFFPHLKLHASTQMAVHNTGGVQYLGGLGVKRVILSRELSFPEIRSIREQNPGIELEVFIHGSLCYGFSGLCLASGIICGRSGNRGDCAQVCRTWFEGPRGKGYYFSCNDLRFGQEVLRLKGIGIDAFKIEGRMKSPEYTGATASLYRHILDNAPPDMIRKDLNTAQVIFSRIPTPAFLNCPQGGDHLINGEYPFPMGLPIGKVAFSERQGFLMRVEQTVMVRDGLLFFRENDPPEPIHFSVKVMRRGNRKVYSCTEGELVYIESPSPPRKGDVIYKTASHNLHWPSIKEGGFRPWKRPVDLTVTLSENSITIAALPPAIPAPDTPPHAPISLTLPTGIERAHKEMPFQEILQQILGETGDSPFRPGRITFINNTSCGDDRIYIHPAHLKKVKNAWYEHLNTGYTSVAEERLGQALRISSAPPAWEAGSATHLCEKYLKDSLPLRSGIIPYDSDPIPFVLDPGSLALGNLPHAGGLFFLPLHPITFNERDYLDGLLRFLESHKTQTFAIGLNNTAHLSWVHTLATLPHTLFFIDYGLYCANRQGFRFFMEHVPRLLFQYFWIEGSDADFDAMKLKAGGSAIPLAPIDKSFHPPLFMSRVCFARHSLESGCRNGCPRNFKCKLSQNKKDFTLIVRDCMTYLFTRLSPA